MLVESEGRFFVSGEKVCVGEHVWRCNDDSICNEMHPESDRGYLGWGLLEGVPKKIDENA